LPTSLQPPNPETIGCSQLSRNEPPSKEHASEAANSAHATHLPCVPQAAQYTFIGL
jgi:hypothetical protein